MNAHQRAEGEASSGTEDVTEPLIAGQLEILQPVVKGIIAHILGESPAHPDVEDGTSDVLRRALEGRARLRSGEPVRPWVLGIARHVAVDLIRQRRRTARFHERPGDSQRGAELHLVDPAPAVDVRLERQQRLQLIRQAMEQLGEEQRNALLLFHVEGLGYREIAAHLDVPVGTVGTWVSRGRRNIAAALDADRTTANEPKS